MIKPITTPGKTYAVTSPNGCTVTQHMGEVDIVTDVPAGLQTLIIAHASKFEIDDDSAIVTECGGSAELVFTAATTRAASSGTGSDGMTAEERALLNGAAQRDADNTFSAGNTFTGAVDMSTASVTPPEGWNVADLTPEAIQQVVPIAFGEGTTAPVATGAKNIAIGANAKTSTSEALAVGSDTEVWGWLGTAVGARSKTGQMGTVLGSASSASETSVAVGHSVNTNGSHAVTCGFRVTTKKTCSITIGAEIEDTSGKYYCTTEGTGSITIGAGANTLNNGDTESSNSVTIGCKAENKGADSVVIGASASGPAAGSVVIGAGAKYQNSPSAQILAIGLNAKTDSLVIGNKANSGAYSVAVGNIANCGNYSTAIGDRCTVGAMGTAVGQGVTNTARRGSAFGYGATAADDGVVVFISSTDNGDKTQLYFSGANTPLANTYEDGEAMIGYVVRDKSGNIMTDAEGNAMVGTQKLSVLFPNNRGENAFTPAMLGLDDEWTPKPMFRPSDLDMPQEEPTEPEEYTPLPVYPIVEPEVPEMEEV